MGLASVRLLLLPSMVPCTTKAEALVFVVVRECFIRNRQGAARKIPGNLMRRFIATDNLSVQAGLVTKSADGLGWSPALDAGPG